MSWFVKIVTVIIIVVVVVLEVVVVVVVVVVVIVIVIVPLVQFELLLVSDMNSARENAAAFLVRLKN